MKTDYVSACIIDDDDLPNDVVEVPKITIYKILTENKIYKIYFFSLDVEGYEISVLNGMDFSNVRPKYFLIETANRPEYQNIVRQYMKDKNYLFVKQLSGNDDLFLDKNF